MIKNPASEANSDQLTPPQSNVSPGGGWAVQLLTTDYVASGYLKAIDMPLAGWLNVPTQNSLSIYQVQTQVLNWQSFAVRGTVPELVVPRSAVVALIPRDEASLRSMASTLPPHPERPMLFYTGTYLIRALVHIPGEVTISVLFGAGTGDMFVVTNAEVHYRRLSAPSSGSVASAMLPAPIMALNKAHIQLYHAGV